MSSIVFIVNPNSGIYSKDEIANGIVRYIDPQSNIKIVFTERRGHARELATDFRDKVDAIIAVGGDGTVNEIGSALIGSETALGIIPSGSGNGLARALDIPIRPIHAIEVINEMVTRRIDVMHVGDHYSINVAGVGFDAFVSHKFARKKNRGPLQYINLIAKEFPTYKANEFDFSLEGRLFSRRAFLISFANSSQWGNNVHIAPRAVLDDGLIDVCVISEFPNIAVPSLLVSLLNESIDSNRYDEIIRAREIEFYNEEPILAHVDGEPVKLGPHAKIRIDHLALKVIVPSKKFLSSHRFSPGDILDIVQQTIPFPPIIKDITKDITNGLNFPR